MLNASVLGKDTFRSSLLAPFKILVLRIISAGNKCSPSLPMLLANILGWWILEEPALEQCHDV
jgi:hypothetical protein